MIDSVEPDLTNVERTQGVREADMSTWVTVEGPEPALPPSHGTRILSKKKKKKNPDYPDYPEVWTDHQICKHVRRLWGNGISFIGRHR